MTRPAERSVSETADSQRLTETLRNQRGVMVATVIEERQEPRPKSAGLSRSSVWSYFASAKPLVQEVLLPAARVS
jgi:hypothetical protein